jgi:hypothetical protein
MPFKVKRGVSDAGRARLLKAAERSTARTMRAMAARQKQFVNALTRAAQPHAAALDKRLRKDGNYARYRKEAAAYQQEVRAIMADAKRASPRYLARMRKAREKWIRKSAAHAQMMREAWRDTITRAKYRADLAAVFQQPEPIMMIEGGFGTFVITQAASGDEAPPGPFVLTAPYDDGSSFSVSALLGLHMDTSFDAATGQVSAEAGAAEAGAAHSFARVGSFITIPPGCSRLWIEAKARIRSELSATSGAAVSYAEMAGHTFFQLDNEEGYFGTQLEQVGAPLFFHEARDADNTYTFSNTYGIPTTGGEYMVGGGVEAYAAAVGAIGVAGAAVTATIKEVRVEIS